MDNVQGTNDSSIFSKYSMVNSGYYIDNCIKYFVRKEVKRAPLINMGYYVRVSIMDNVVQTFLKDTIDQEIQVISLGAGFDTKYFNLLLNNNKIKYVEIDLPEVVRKKVEMIKDSDLLLEKITQSKENITFGEQNEFISSQNYSIFSHDLNYLEGLEKKLDTFGLKFNTCTLVFSECAITYMEEGKSTHLIHWMQTKLKRAIFVTYEQINPDDAFGRVMVSHFIKIQSPLKSVHKYKTLQHQCDRYLSCGWTFCNAITAMEIVHNLGQMSWETFRKEPFDEFEEWNLKCCHYALTVASNFEYSTIWNMFKSSNRNFASTTTCKGPTFKWEVIPEMVVQRFGHSCLHLFDDRLLIIGGFGSQGKKHSRMKTILDVSLGTCKMTSIIPECLKIGEGEGPIWDCMYSTCTKISENEFILYGGRTSPLKPVNSSPWICQFNNNNDHSITNTILPSSSELIKNETDQQPLPRWRHSAVLISPGNILIFGGITVGLKVLDDLWLLTISEKSNSSKMLAWSVPKSHSDCLQSSVKPKPSFSHSAAVYDGTMYITGGFNDGMLPLNYLLSYHLKKGWEKVNTVPELKPRYSHTSHVTSQKQLILLGGVNMSENNQPGLTIVCLNTFTALECDILAQEIESPILMLHNHRSIYQHDDNSLYIVGGGGNCFSFGTHFNTNIVRLCLTKNEDNLGSQKVER